MTYTIEQLKLAWCARKFSVTSISDWRAIIPELIDEIEARDRQVAELQADLQGARGELIRCDSAIASDVRQIAELQAQVEVWKIEAVRSNSAGIAEIRQQTARECAEIVRLHADGCTCNSPDVCASMIEAEIDAKYGGAK